LNVVVTLKPVHSLVAALMQGVEQPKLLLDDSQSPHSMSLRPSQRRMLNEADLIVWIGDALEPSLSHLLQSRQSRAEVVSMLESPGLHLLQVRDSKTWSSHDHSHHRHDGEPETTPERSMPQRSMPDSHIWLSPANALQMVRHLTRIVTRLDEPNRERYMQNSRALLTRLQALDEQLRSDLEPVKTIPYVVFHDAYQYFEAHYGLNAVGSVNIDPDQLSGARHIHQLRQTIQSTRARCLFTEPQFEPKLANTLAEGLALNIDELDPLGTRLPAGPESYFMLMHGLSNSLVDCLSRETGP
jgi:zinc transport system substrate-binding protein